MNSQQYSEINDLLSRVPGNIIDFRVYKGANFAFLVKLATKHDRLAIGIDFRRVGGAVFHKIKAYTVRCSTHEVMLKSILILCSAPLKGIWGN